MAAPSGRFCTPTPSASDTAPSIIAGSPDATASAKHSPTAMPSGMLCSVTAAVSKAVLRLTALRGRGMRLSPRRRSMSTSSTSRNTVPSAMPPVTGKNAGSAPPDA